MTPQHRWIEAKLARDCEKIGYAATPEDYRTHADVYVHGPGYALEVQRGRTDFAGRTRAREDKGAKVMWFLTEDATSQGASEALFTLPAVRLRVVAHDDWGRRLSPWDNPSENAQARLVVWGSVVKRLGPTGELETSSMDATSFLRQVFEGRRVWLPPRPRSPGVPRRRGLWALLSDVDAQSAFRSARRDATHPRTPVRPAVAQASPPRLEESASAINTTSSPSVPTAPVADAEEPLEDPPPPELEVATAEPAARRSWWRRMLGWLIEE